jgi:hypothetical protein
MTPAEWMDLYICIILTIELWYDKWWNDTQSRKKRRAKDKELGFDHLNIGEHK